MLFRHTRSTLQPYPRRARHRPSHRLHFYIILLFRHSSLVSSWIRLMHRHQVHQQHQRLLVHNMSLHTRGLDTQYRHSVRFDESLRCKTTLYEVTEFQRRSKRLADVHSDVRDINSRPRELWCRAYRSSTWQIDSWTPEKYRRSATEYYSLSTRT